MFILFNKMKMIVFINLICILLNSYTALSIKKNSFLTNNKSLSLMEFNKKFFMNNNMNVKTHTQNDIKKSDSNDCNAIMQGWVKYLEITEDASDVPTCFIKNNLYFLQSNDNPGMNTTAKDNIGFLNIPNEDYFFFKLCDSELKIFTARTEKYKKFEKSLNLKDLIPQFSTTPCKGGVEDVGNFDEGYCFMLKFINFSTHIIWELCTDNITQKTKWMDAIMKQTNRVSVSTPSVAVNVGIAVPDPFETKRATTFSSPPFVKLSPVMPQQIVQSSIALGQPSSIFTPSMPPSVLNPPNGVIQATPLINWSPCSKPCGGGIQKRPIGCSDLAICKSFEERLCNVQACKEEVEQSLDKLKKVSQGQWELLGSWSPCSRSCGGGVQTIERRCVGNDCEGDAVLVQNCNTFICAGDPDKMIINAAEIFNKNSFDECKLLEGNLLLVVNNQRVFSHVQVDRQNIQIYSENNPAIPITVPLAQLLDIHQSSTTPGCFKISDINGKNTLLCPEHPESIIY